MIRLARNEANESLVQIRLSNGWTVSLAPHANGTATIAAWASHDDVPRFGRMMVVGGDPVDGDALTGFLASIAAVPAPVVSMPAELPS